MQRAHTTKTKDNVNGLEESELPEIMMQMEDITNKLLLFNRSNSMKMKRSMHKDSLKLDIRKASTK
jgi:hypothetical protein